jgi:hypothetical protein
MEMNSVLADYYRVSPTAANAPLPDLPSESVGRIHHFRRERYLETSALQHKRVVDQGLVRTAYYLIRKLLPVAVRRHLQRAYLSDWRQLSFPSWPVDFSVDTAHQELLRASMMASGVTRVPFIWFWPQGAPSCLIMTHDVETASGRDFCSTLMDIDASYGFKSSFQVVPEVRYDVPAGYVREIRDRGFEFNIHDLNHDGHLFRERAEFLRRAEKINGYCRKYQANGFRAGAMYRNPDWYDAFQFSYDMSVPNVAHLEPQRGGCCTVMPYFIGRILELPLTATQDYSLFHILNAYSLDLWKQQVDLIHQRNGLISFIAHPDYLMECRARSLYEALLDYLRQRVARERIWAALPGEVDRWWRARNQMQLVFRDKHWEIEGPDRERARLAYAVLDAQNNLSYEIGATVPLRA